MKRTSILFLLALSLVGCCARAIAQHSLPPALEPPKVTVRAPAVTAPPESFFQMISNRIASPSRGRGRDGPRRNAAEGSNATNSAVDTQQPSAAPDSASNDSRVQDELAIYRAFYKKYIDVQGMPVVAHSDIADLALQRTYEIVTHMLAGRPDILSNMVSNRTYLIVIGKNQLYTDMPEYRNHPNPQFQNERVRGTGGNPTSFGEENLLSLPIDRYDDESIAVHEFCHTIDSTLRRMDSTWNERRNAAYQNAIKNKLYENTYAAGNSAEYWAEIAQAYFDCNRVNNWNHGPIGTRAQLEAHDPLGYELCRSVFNLKPEQDWRYTWLQKLPMVSAPPTQQAFQNIDPWYTKFTWAREFTVLGRNASDDALLHANETIRRLFAYRHDVLKALIGDGVKLVVLGPNEKITDLPEFRKVPDASRPDPGTRCVTYNPQMKLLVVHQDDVLRSAESKDVIKRQSTLTRPDGHPLPIGSGEGRGEGFAGNFSRLSGDNPVIRVFADALYKVAGLRPAIPNFRGDQQYELRVKRLDLDFDQAVTELFEKARAANKWREYPAAHDKFAYWTAGVLAYFDAADQACPANTREKLEAYDPGLFALVNETMGYRGKVDWRYRPFGVRAAENQVYQSPPQQRADGRPRQSGRRGVLKAKVAPHWFSNNTRFWYRNDLGGGAREFIVVDAQRGTRERAFDHARLAAQIGSDAEPLQLPVDELQFSDDGRTVTLIGSNKKWQLDLGSGKLEETSGSAPEAGREGLTPEAQPRASSRTGPETEITFDNRLDQPVEIFWLDDQAQRRSYGRVEPRSRRAQHTFAGHVWLVADARGQTLAVFEAEDRPDLAVIDGKSSEPRQGRTPRRERSREARSSGPARSPDGQWVASVKEHNLFIRSEAGEEIQLSTDGSADHSYARPTWSPDSKRVVAWRMEPGERKPVHLVRSSPPGGGRAQLESRAYVLPGDKFSRYEVNLFDVASRKQLKPDVDRFEHEWLSPRIHWNREGSRFTYLQVDRGHQRLRIIEVDAISGQLRHILDEKSNTFIWTAHTENLRLELVNWLEGTDEIIYVSEQDGWRHLYLIDVPDASMRQITKGAWVVRGIERIDEEARQIWFSASGRNPGQDPYFLHHYRVNFDGSGFIALTEANGQHAIEFSPDRKYVIDTWSRVDAPPVNELRRTSDGTLICKLEEADASELVSSGWVAPEPFVAKGRDGRTDIWGVIHRPRQIDPAKKYPVIESVYAGPQGSFVPKSFSEQSRFSSLTELGFVVVQIDGMGTANRSKAFHDVCYKNLKDGGFPDRILWIKAAAAKYPYLDLSRVGVYGNSAGGQNAAAAVLFHPEFYKAAVASCGCHDNRMDKASWNEQWMGYMPADKIWSPGPENWFSQCSNIDNAHRLQGNLFLIVGEMDNNVPPESTMRFADALIRAGKDFDLLVIPNGGHGMGGLYGDRRMRDFFARHLLAVEPPQRNRDTATVANSGQAAGQ